MLRTDFAGLEVFLAIVRAGSLRGAAAALNVQPPAVSQKLKQFEDALGVTLIQRSTRSLSLTEYGEILLRGGAQAAERLDATLDELRARADRPSGPLRVTVPRVVNDHIIGARLWDFQLAYPEIELDVIVADPLIDIIADGIDAGVRMREEVQPDMRAVRLTNPLSEAVIATPDYLERHGTPTTPDALVAHSGIRYRFGRSGALAPWNFLTPDGERTITPLPGPIVNDPRAMVMAALKGVGIGYILREAARREIETGRLVSLFDDLCPTYPGLFLYYPASADRSHRLRAFIDFMKLK